MKTLKESILSSTKTGKVALFIPETKDELMQMIRDEIMKNGLKCDLNHIQTHKITDMSSLFYLSHFNGDISKWDVSNVVDMNYMFYGSRFNSDISKWDVSNVVDMHNMFKYSHFNQDISNWKINSKCNINHIFNSSCIKNKNKPKKNGKTIK